MSVAVHPWLSAVAACGVQCTASDARPSSLLVSTPPFPSRLLTATWTCLWACWLTRCTLNGTGLQGEREREREIEGERERGEGEREGEVIVGDYSNLFLTSARSLGCVADCSLKPESCNESQLLTLSTSSYGVLVVHYGMKKWNTQSESVVRLGGSLRYVRVCIQVITLF